MNFIYNTFSQDIIFNSNFNIVADIGASLVVWLGTSHLISFGLYFNLCKMKDLNQFSKDPKNRCWTGIVYG